MMNRKNSYNTKQKDVIKNFLVENKNNYVTVNDILAYLLKQNIHVGIATIYRTLDNFVLQGIVRRYVTGESSAASYQFVDKDNQNDYCFHLKCTCCNKIFDVECCALMEMSEHIKAKHNFSIDNSMTFYYGLCSGCSAKTLS
ncbi:MAG: transcriptional repressor [Bacillota bacterium]|nr:transcriptional repressor [Bacillota bacterium]